MDQLKAIEYKKPVSHSCVKSQRAKQDKEAIRKP